MIILKLRKSDRLAEILLHFLLRFIRIQRPVSTGPDQGLGASRFESRSGGFPSRVHFLTLNSVFSPVSRRGHHAQIFDRPYWGTDGGRGPSTEARVSFFLLANRSKPRQEKLWK
jgi:hypothetical protein